MRSIVQGCWQIFNMFGENRRGLGHRTACIIFATSESVVISKSKVKNKKQAGRWVAQLVKSPTLSFSSSKILQCMSLIFDPFMRLQANIMEPAQDFLSLSK